jgi:hypothetical protein
VLQAFAPDSVADGRRCRSFDGGRITEKRRVLANSGVP